MRPGQIYRGRTLVVPCLPARRTWLGSSAWRDTGRAMSQENVEVVRAIYGAFAGRDGDALVRHLDPSVRVYGRPFHPGASVYEGREGFLRFSETDWEAFEE